MPLRLGSQFPIGNGSSVAFLGVQRVESEHLEDWEEEPGHWVYFMAHIECEQPPPSGKAGHIMAYHARAIWVLMCPNSFERPHTFLIYPPDGNDWLRVMFRRRIEGKLREPAKYLRATAGVLKGIWSLVYYAEYRETDKNKVLTFDLARNLPVQPYQVHIYPRTPVEVMASRDSEENVSLGFDMPEAEKVACGILRFCRDRGTWGPHGWSIPESLSKKWRMRLDEFNAGLQFLIKCGYLVAGDARSAYFLRESFVVHCWRASLCVPSSELPL